MSERVHSVDALRGVLALCVAVYHLTSWTRALGYETLATSVMTLVGIGAVQAFFVVSGFGFYHAYAKSSFREGPEIVRFHLKRVARIAPLYYAAMLANASLQTGYGAPASATNLFENLTLTFGIAHPNHSYLMGGWSIGIEMVFYLVFPFLAAHTRSFTRVLALALVLFALAMPWTFVWVPEAVGHERFHTYVAVPNHFFAFFLGGAVAHARAAVRYRLPLPVYLPLVTAVAAMLLVDQEIFVDHGEATFGVLRLKSVLVMAAIVAVTAFYDVSSTLGRWVAERVGWVSYGVYLIHPLVWFSVGRPLYEDDLGPSASVLLTLTITLALAYLSYLGIERPVLLLARRKLRRAPRDGS